MYPCVYVYIYTEMLSWAVSCGFALKSFRRRTGRTFRNSPEDISAWWQGFWTEDMGYLIGIWNRWSLTPGWFKHGWKIHSQFLRWFSPWANLYRIFPVMGAGVFPVVHQKITVITSSFSPRCHRMQPGRSPGEGRSEWGKWMRKTIQDGAPQWCLLVYKPH